MAFVLEAARANGAIVSSRKGVTTARLRIHGRAAHAGVEPEKGRSAILAAGNLIVGIHAMNGRWEDTTANVGVMAGGTRANVVAEEASLEAELRSYTEAGLSAAEAELERLASDPGVAGVRVEIDLDREYRPMEQTPATSRLVALAQDIADEIGFTLHDEASGGASDANTTARVGLPTLDGLGPVGGDDHSEREWIDLRSIVPRAALLAGLIGRAGEAVDRRD